LPRPLPAPATIREPIIALIRAIQQKRQTPSSHVSGALSDSISIIHFACVPREWRPSLAMPRNGAFQD
jgi:hypothetical protein